MKKRAVLASLKNLPQPLSLIKFKATKWQKFCFEAEPFCFKSPTKTWQRKFDSKIGETCSECGVAKLFGFNERPNQKTNLRKREKMKKRFWRRRRRRCRCRRRHWRNSFIRLIYLSSDNRAETKNFNWCKKIKCKKTSFYFSQSPA